MTENNSIQNAKDDKKQRSSHIPLPRNSPLGFTRSGSLKLKGELRPRFGSSHSTASTPERPAITLLGSPVRARKNPRRHRSLQSLPRDELDDDGSEKSFDSSCNSSICAGRHSQFAHNETTYSGRSMRYIHYCSPNTGSEEYLTPTQRANRTIKRLRQMLADAQSELIEKENEIDRLTKEVVELRLLNISNTSSTNLEKEESTKSDEVTEPAPPEDCGSDMYGMVPRFMDILHEENDTADGLDDIKEISSNVSATNNNIIGCDPMASSSPHHAPHSPSLADSGHFEDINYTLLHSVEKEYEKLKQVHEEMREKHNEKVEQLLKAVEEANNRYYELNPKYVNAEFRIRELEKENVELKEKLDQHEIVKSSTQYRDSSTSPEVEEKNIEDVESVPSVSNLMRKLSAARKEIDQLKVGAQSPSANPDLKSDNDPEITLRFLKSAVYYLLTDPSNAKDHLSAIESMLGYTEMEKHAIEKANSWKY